MSVNSLENLYEVFSNINKDEIQQVFEINEQNYEKTFETLLTFEPQDEKDENKKNLKDEKDLNFLSSIIDLNEDIINMIYLENEKNLEKTLDVLLNLKLLEDEEEEDDDDIKEQPKKNKFEENVDTLHALFPHLSKEAITAELIVGNSDVKFVHRKLESQIYIEKEKKKQQQRIKSKQLLQNDDNESFLSVTKKAKNIKPQKQKYIQLSHNNVPSKLSSKDNSYNEPSFEERYSNLSSKELRQIASELARERNQYFSLAIQAFQRGDGKSAKEFSEKGKKANFEMHQKNYEATSNLIKKNENENNKNTLDLHGFYVKEALDVLEQKLKNLKSLKKIFIITGTGQHSKHGKAKLRPEVNNYLKNRNYKFKEVHPGNQFTILNILSKEYFK
eukprot:gene4167-7477_t